jgi:hypothetical protein
MAVTKKSDTAWTQPATPPPPLFTGEKERNLVKQVNDELIERVIGQQIAYFAIDVDRSDFHPLYGEAILKTFLPPVRVYALVKWEGQTQSFTQNLGIDKGTSIEIHFHKKRLTEDQDLFVREGDFVLYGDRYYEIVQLSEPRQLFGQIENKFEIKAKAIRAREGIFNPQFTANTVPTTRQVTSSSTGSASTYNPTIDAIFTNITATNNLTIHDNSFLGNHPSDKVIITGSVDISGSLFLNGQSITAISASNITFNTRVITSSYTITPDDYFIGVDTNYANIVVTLPTPASVNNGKIYVIKDISGLAATNIIKLSASTGQQIDLEPFTTLDIEHVAVSVYRDSTGWYIF